MSYRCSVCRNAVPPKTQMLRHTTTKLDRLGHVQISSEVPVCQSCHTKLTGKAPISLDDLTKQYRKKEIEVIPIGLSTKGIDFDHW